MPARQGRHDACVFDGKGHGGDLAFFFLIQTKECINYRCFPVRSQQCLPGFAWTKIDLTIGASVLVPPSAR